MTALRWFFAFTTVALLLVVLGVLHVRVKSQEIQIAFDHGKVGRGVKLAFLKCREWLRRDKHEQERLADKVHKEKVYKEEEPHDIHSMTA